MIITRLALIIFFYLAIRWILPLNTSWFKKIVLTLLLGGAIAFHWGIRYRYGSLASPEISQNILMFSGWCFGGVMILAIVTLIIDAFKIVRLLAGLALKPFVGKQRRVFGSKKPPRPPLLLSVSPKKLAVLVLFTYALTAWGVYQAVRIPDVKNIEIALPDLYPEQDGTTIVFITDMHASALFTGERTRKLVEEINELKPDLILFGGDMVDGRVSMRREAVEPLRELKSRLGIYGCTGNHEYYSDYTEWMDAFNKLGLHMLENEHVTLTVNGKPLTIAGVTDSAAERFGLPMPDPVKALKGSVAGSPKILLAHRPEEAGRNAAAGADLQLSGHTHGGQFLGLNLIVEDRNGGYLSGFYDVNGMILYVSNGSGLWNGLPMRIGVPAEITRITLKRAPQSSAQ